MVMSAMKRYGGGVAVKVQLESVAMKTMQMNSLEEGESGRDPRLANGRTGA